jgi:hypothetical protein
MSVYSVKSIRITRDWFGTKRFYLPIYDEHGIQATLSSPDEMDSVWGYETEDAAWAVIDAAIRNDQDFECGSFDSSREDFHADG